jgi:predicted glycoside hydrolase/deacetylase ChbG (UPF0249 family)
MQNLIINADDFGISKEVNYAIMAVMDANLCKDTTLLVNFEDSVHAAELAIMCNRKNNVGIHLNLTEGFPLTSGIKNEPLFCNAKGLFHYNREKRIIKLSKSEKKAVYNELISQIQLCRNLGIPISHADSHSHVHEEPGLFLLIMDILKKEDIPLLRLTNNLGKTTIQNKFYRNSYNAILSYNKLAGTNYFGSASDLIDNKKMIETNSIIEIMIHPGQLRNNQIFDVYSNENLSLLLSEIIEGNNLMSYSQLDKYKFIK